MGGHGGLNILPQKKWNVYNYDNRDIVEKDKKLHQEKLKSKYQLDRKTNLQNKFQVLKSQGVGSSSINEERFKNEVKKDSILNNEFKRLAEEKQHINLFEYEQKIVENREVLQYKRLRQGQLLKQKDLDYSSKFLGTYNQESRIPWYARNKNVKIVKNVGNSNNNNNKSDLVGRQRYQMDDLVDEMRREKERRDYRFKRQDESVRQVRQKQSKDGERMKYRIKRQQKDERQRSRDRKYEFWRMKGDYLGVNDVNKKKEEDGQLDRVDGVNGGNEEGEIRDIPEQKGKYRMSNDDEKQGLNEANKYEKQRKSSSSVVEVTHTHPLKYQQQQNNPQTQKQESQQMTKLRQKRLKRQLKQQQKINLLKINLIRKENHFI